MNHLFAVKNNCASALVSAPDAASAKLLAIRDFFADAGEALTVRQIPDAQQVSIDDDGSCECATAGSIAARETGVVATTEHP